MKFHVDTRAPHTVRDEEGYFVFGGFSSTRSQHQETERAAELARRWNAYEDMQSEIERLKKLLDTNNIPC